MIRIPFEHLHSSVLSPIPVEFRTCIIGYISIELAEFIWRNKETVPICEQCGRALHVIYKYLLNEEPWGIPISYIVPCDFAFEACTNDASRYGIGTQIPCLKVWCMIPFAPLLVRWASLLSSHPEYIHIINVLEYLGILL